MLVSHYFIHSGAIYGDNSDIPAVNLNTDYSNLVIVEGLPIVGKDKYEKLASALRVHIIVIVILHAFSFYFLLVLECLQNKYFAKYGTVNADYFYLPFENEQTTGYCFVEYSTAAEALAAIEGLNNTLFDKVHRFHIYPYSYFETTVDYPEMYVEPEATAEEVG